MKVTHTVQNGIAILRLEGDFDSFETELVREGFENCLKTGQTSIVLDLGDLTFANSTTIAYFITAQKKAGQQGGQVILARPRDFILKTLSTLGLNQVFSIRDSVEDAVSALKSG